MRISLLRCLALVLILSALAVPLPADETYAIQRGDTLSSLARKFGISITELESANPGVNPTRLQIGQKIAVPARDPSATVNDPSVGPRPPPPSAAAYEPATTAVNQLGLDLFRQLAAANRDGNLLLSPYSIQNALAMTYAGADGETRAEMARVLNFPKDDATLADSFAALRAAFDAAVKESSARRAEFVGSGGKMDRVEWHEANRLFAERDFSFRQPFLDFARDRYAAPLQPLDFKNNAEAARGTINTWVADQTKQRIPDLIPLGSLKTDTRLVLVNAIYFKAPWEEEFGKGATTPRVFQVHGKDEAKVPTMFNEGRYGYAKREGYTAVTVPYLGAYLQLLILVPDQADGLDALAAKASPDLLRSCAQLTRERVRLWLPKLKFAPPTIQLSDALKTLGLKTAFDLPPGTANFDRMAPRKTSEYLAIAEVYHKTFFSLDEESTEAAAATAVHEIAVGNAGPRFSPPPPPEVHVDHPFLFAIQEWKSGACLFLGRVTDPR
jgi:serine protease inhibitor